MNKKEGSAVVEATVIFSITMILILVIFTITIGIVQNQSEMVSDDLLSSELAAYKHINKKELGASQNIDIVIINEHKNAFDTFKEYLKVNLGLNELFVAANEHNFIKGKVDILLFKIYNVKGNDIEIITYTSDSVTIKSEPNGLGKIETPKGNVVMNTTIYSEIGFYIKPMLLNKKYVKRNQETDIVTK